MVNEDILECFDESSRIISESGQKNANIVAKMAQEIINCFEKGSKILIFGNGGSASQAQHFSAEIVNKFKFYRKALPAIALTTDTAILTSISNDLDYDSIFSRQVEALGQKGDIVWGLSTSGSSANVIKAFDAAKKAGVMTISFTGEKGSKLESVSDICLTVSSKNTPNIQEVHLCAGHIICDVIEKYFLAKA
jgi:D-sedoheptulose 7-phosphate isomerase